MLKELRQPVLFTLVTMALLGGVYHLAIWLFGVLLFPAAAEGSLVRRAGGQEVVGSRLIAQAFTRPEYFHPRPSGVDYNAAATGGTNFGPSNPDHLALVRLRLEAVVAREGVAPEQVPSEMVTAGGGLDPHIPPAAAALQAPRIAAARGVPLQRVQAAIRQQTEGPAFGFLGRERVNVFELNLALDEAFPIKSPAMSP